MAKRVLSKIARRLNEFRETAGMCQQILTVAVGLSASLVLRFEQRSRSDPRIGTTAALAKALGESLDDLVDGAPDLSASASDACRRRFG